ncbi:MAG TPA: dipeptidase [Pyrinomonadaceae bacterium]|nr:dipeptidase [Pyrinomonadaceae bacterium]
MIANPLKKIGLVFLVLFLGAVPLLFLVVPPVADSKLNPVLNRPPYVASERAQALHKQLTIVDLHADTLLWQRDPVARNDRGHVDIPRLIEGNVALQAFTIVTKTPRGLNIENNNDQSDNITLLAIAQLWPRSTWRSLKERALYQAVRLKDAAERSNGNFVFIKTKSDLAAYLKRRASDRRMSAGFLGVEGAHALEGDLNNIDLFYDYGIRMMAPTHFFDNDIGGSAHGVTKGGLTDKGKQMVKRMQAKSMIVDLAHASSAVISDVLQISTRPVVVSHTGVKGTCNNTRNLSDEQLKGIAKTGGLIGIGYWETAVCGRDAKAIARAIRYTANVVGVEYVGLGSDFDGAVAEPFDTTGLVQVTDALIAEGFSDDEIKLIMGGNAIRVLSLSLPA